jgi:dTDP-4-amino-4,6-dideoxy-D-galactose acyltransferase
MKANADSADPCTLLPWDTQFWGFPVARLAAATLTTATAEEAVAWCSRHGVRCLYFLAAGSCHTTLALAAEHGFRFVDIRVELARALLEPLPARAPAGSIRVRPAAPDDLPELRRLAAASHHDSRFFKDDRFEAARAQDLYREWVARDFARHEVLVCESPAKPGVACGYVSCEIDTDRREGRIGLIAVAADRKAAGFGSALVAAALHRFSDAQLSYARVVTQGTNVAALRLYERSGFLTSQVGLWFHKWFDVPRRT